MRFVQYELPLAQEARAYYYLGDSENVKIATHEQRIPINYFPTPTVEEQDALALMSRYGFAGIEVSRPNVHVSVIDNKLNFYLQIYPVF